MKKPLSKHYIEDDILLVHKPIGITSFDVVARMRKILGTKKVGHAGTLDPLASGLMIVGFNKGTKKIEHYMKRDKTYIADVVIGYSTTTGDAEGDIIETKIPDKGDMKQVDLEQALESLYGEQYYPAPLYSAVKVQGKPLYAYAREGIEPPFIPEKKMDIKKIDIFDIYKSGNTFIVTIRVQVGSGTYIRTLAEEFGKKIGYPASLKRLYRTSIDGYADTDAYHFENQPSPRKTLYDIIKGIFTKKI